MLLVRSVNDMIYVFVVADLYIIYNKKLNFRSLTATFFRVKKKEKKSG